MLDVQKGESSAGVEDRKFWICLVRLVPLGKRIIGCGIAGPNAGDLIAEAGLAIEMGADAHDIGLTIHPHPTLSETFAMAAEMFYGSITDLIPPKKKAKQHS